MIESLDLFEAYRQYLERKYKSNGSDEPIAWGWQEVTNSLVLSPVAIET